MLPLAEGVTTQVNPGSYHGSLYMLSTFTLYQLLFEIFPIMCHWLKKGSIRNTDFKHNK